MASSHAHDVGATLAVVERFDARHDHGESGIENHFLRVDVEKYRGRGTGVRGQRNTEGRSIERPISACDRTGLAGITIDFLSVVTMFDVTHCDIDEPRLRRKRSSSVNTVSDRKKRRKAGRVETWSQS